VSSPQPSRFTIAARRTITNPDERARRLAQAFDTLSPERLALARCLALAYQRGEQLECEASATQPDELAQLAGGDLRDDSPQADQERKHGNG
jgi:hypothetical protein